MPTKELTILIFFNCNIISFTQAHYSYPFFPIYHFPQFFTIIILKFLSDFWILLYKIKFLVYCLEYTRKRYTLKNQ